MAQPVCVAVHPVSGYNVLMLAEDQPKVISRLKFWPSPAEYSEALQTPQLSLFDQRLWACEAETDSLGLPRPISGGFASVYRLKHVRQNDWALRCFLQPIPDQQQRYEKISRFVMNDDLPYTVSFDYLLEGVRIRSQAFPVLKMEWVNGDTLERYIEKNLGTPAINRLCENFKQMCAHLHAAGIAHGDFQHGNIMVTPENQLRLVDYDGMYVPELAGVTSNELGHRNYQHPAREAKHFGPSLDNFSALVIYTSLRAIAIDPSLYRKLDAGDDCLLFRRDDFLYPLTSRAFLMLETHSSGEIRHLAQCVRWQLSVRDPLEVIPLSSIPAKLPVALTRLLPAGDAPLGSARGDVSKWWKEYFDTEFVAHEIEPELLKPPLTGGTAGAVRSTWIKREGWPMYVLLFLLTVVVEWVLIQLVDENSRSFFNALSVGAPLYAFMMMGWIVSHGTPATGEVFMKYRCFDRYALWYRFIAVDEHGNSIKRVAEMSVTEQQWRSVKEGDRLTVLYLQDSPTFLISTSVLYKFAKCRAV